MKRHPILKAVTSVLQIRVRRWSSLSCLMMELVFCGSIGLRSASAEEADFTKTPPILSLETGGHTAVCQWLGFTPDGNQLVSVGDDKVVRIWNVSDPARPQLARSIRLPIGYGYNGRIYRGALSPDGRWLAVSGYPNQWGIRILDLASGELAGLLFGHEDTIGALAFSSDGRWLISGSGDKTIGLWNVSQLSQTQGDPRAPLSTWLRGLWGKKAEPNDSNTKLKVEGIALRAHTSDVTDIRARPTANGRSFVSASFDKTARIWEQAIEGTWREIATLGDHSDELFQVACSPDGAWIATSCEDGSVRLWTGTGRLVRVLIDHSDDPDFVEGRGIEFTRDSQSLVIGGTQLAGGCLVVSVADGVTRAKFAGHDNNVFAVACRPHRQTDATRLVASTGGDQNEIILWDADSGREVSRIVGRGKMICSVAFSPDGQRIAYGQINDGNPLDGNLPLTSSFDLATIEPGPAVQAGETWIRGALKANGLKGAVYEGEDKTLTLVRGKKDVLQITRNQDGDDITCFAFIPDKGQIVVGSYFNLALHDTRTGDVLRQFIGHTGAITAVAVSPDGRYLLSASDDQTMRIWRLDELPGRRPAIGVVTQSDDQRRLVVQEVYPDLPGAIAGLQVGDILVRANGNKLSTPEQFIDLIKTTLSGQSINVVIQRGDETLKGKVTPQLILIPDEVPPVLNLFVTTDGQDWVVSTSEGYYKCSPQGDHLIGWQFNHRLDETPRFLMSWQLRRRLNRPEIVEQVLQRGSTAAALQFVAQQHRERPEPAFNIAQNPDLQAVPVVRLTAPLDGIKVTSSRLALKGSITLKSGKLQSVRVTVNGRPVEETRNIGRAQPPMAEGQSQATESVVPLNIEVPLVPGRNVIEVVALTNSVTSQPQRVEVTYEAPRSTVSKPSLYVLTLGVSKYADQRLALEHADADARGLADAFATQEGAFYEKVHSKVLVNQDVTERELRRGLRWLRESATQHDLVVVSVSGHGMCDPQGNYFFIPHDFDVDEPSVTGIRWTEIMEPLKDLPAKVLLCMDTCHSAGVLGGKAGAATKKDLSHSLEAALREMTAIESGLVVMTSSTGREASLEHPDWGHGAFTLSLIEALSNQRRVSAEQTRLPADLNGDGVIEVVELDAYVTQRVKELTAGRQHPVTRRGDIPSFPIGLIKPAS